MCIFTGRVAHVGGTKIFARLTANEAHGIAQYLVYSMSVSTDSEVAMILPLPASSQTEDALNFIHLNGYPEFFEDMEKGFLTPIGGLGNVIAGDAGLTRVKLAVQSVGDFIASFVPTLADFDRLDIRFRLPAATWNKLPQYSDWGFAVFQLKESPADQASAKGAARRIHPMAFQFPTWMDESLYFPTLHIHDGHVNASAEFDHTLYFQGDEFQHFAEQISPSNADAFMKMDKAMGIVQRGTVCGKRSIAGINANEDTYAGRAE
jgi:hypothetical protein